VAGKSDAYIDGWLAHKFGENNSDENNPYDQHKQAMSHQQWLSGWCDRFGRCKHDGELTYDEAQFQD
jgi:hypothetical protein